MLQSIDGIGCTKDTADKISERRHSYDRKGKMSQDHMQRDYFSQRYPWPEAYCGYDQEKRYLGMLIEDMRKKGAVIKDVDFHEVFSGVVLREKAEDRLLFGRTDWKPSVDACLSLMEADVVTVGDFINVGFFELETDYCLKDKDARELEKLLNTLGFCIGRPRNRKIYDDWKRSSR